MNFSFFHKKKSISYELRIYFKIKTEYIPIDFNVTFLIQTSEFTKSLKFGSNSKKKLQK